MPPGSHLCEMIWPWLFQPTSVKAFKTCHQVNIMPAHMAMAISAKGGASLGVGVDTMICSILKLVVAMKEHTSIFQVQQLGQNM
eukprot:6486663-Amphidinium_carterae.1